MRAALGGAVLALATIPACAQDVVARISYVEHHDRILPKAQQTATSALLEVRLKGDGTVKHEEARASGRARGNASAALKLGASDNKGWRVAGPNQLINITDFPSYQRAILLTVNGASCTARVAYTLKPGFKDYRYKRLTTGEDAVARSVTATQERCSIQ